MEHFTIELPGNKIGHVQRLKVHKVKFSHAYNVGSLKQVSASGPKYTKVGFKYSVAVSGDKTEPEYCLYKSQNGEWFKDPEFTFQIDDSELLIIRNLISEKEKEFPARGTV